MQSKQPIQTSANFGWLTRLGIVGLDAIEAPVLAALATETPLLFAPIEF